MKILPAFLLSFCFANAFSQEIHSPLKFKQGQELNVSLQVKSTISQQAMGQSIDFNVDATGDHRFAVTNATDDNTTLHHDVTRLRFFFEGMGQRRSFDSREEKDMNGPFGKYAKDIISRNYDMIIDQQGQTLMTRPEMITMSVEDPRLAIINAMLKDVVSIVYPPKKNEPGFFQVFPNEALKEGLAWSRTAKDSTLSITEVYKITGITDTAIVIDYAAESVTITKAEMMGSQTVTTMNNKSTGTILVDPRTNILISKSISTESNGSSEAPFGTIPVTSKSELVMRVDPSK